MICVLQKLESKIRGGGGGGGCQSIPVLLLRHCNCIKEVCTVSTPPSSFTSFNIIYRSKCPVISFQSIVSHFKSIMLVITCAVQCSASTTPTNIFDLPTSTRSTIRGQINVRQPNIAVPWHQSCPLTEQLHLIGAYID